MRKIRLTSTALSNFTGLIHNVQFLNGESVNELDDLTRVRFNAIFGAVELDGSTELPIGYTEPDSAWSGHDDAGTSNISEQLNRSGEIYYGVNDVPPSVLAEGDVYFQLSETDTISATLGTLSLTNVSVATGSAETSYVGTITGRTPGSTLELIDDAGGRFTLSGYNILTGATPTNITSANSHTITIRETLAGRTNSPNTTAIVIYVVPANGAGGGGIGDVSDLPVAKVSHIVGQSATDATVAAKYPVTLIGETYRVEKPLEFNNFLSSATVTLPDGMRPKGESFAITQRGPSKALTFGPMFTANSTRYVYRYTSGTTQYFDARIREPGHYQIPLVDEEGNERDLEFYVLPRNKKFGDPWDPDVLDHWNVRTYKQEDVAEGPVALWLPTGMITRKGSNIRQATQSDPLRQPVKLAGMAGVEFPTGAFMTFGITENQRAYYTRTTLTIFRVNPTSGTSVTYITCPGQNLTGRKNRQSALLAYPTAARVDWNDRSGTNTMIKPGLYSSYDEWHFVIHFHRDGQLWVSWDGAEPEPSPNNRFRPGGQEGLDMGDNGYSYLGHSSNSTTTALTFAIDCVREFPESSEELINKIGWWAKERIKTLPNGETFELPSTHKYYTYDAVIDESDFPSHHIKIVPGDWRWHSDVCRAMRSDKEFHPNFAYRGSYDTLPEVEAEFSQRVFLDDFRARSVSDSDGSADAIWHTKGGMAGTTVGASNLIEASSSASYITHYPDTQTMSIKAGYSGGLRGTVISNVDLLDNGITTKGPTLFKYRYRSKDVGTPRTGMWGALWSYSNNRLKAPASVNIEIDFPEYERWTANGSYTTINIARHESNAFAGYNGRMPTEPRSTDNRLGEKLIDVLALTSTYTTNPFPADVNHYKTNGDWTEQAVLVGDDWFILWIDGFEIGRFKTDRYSYLCRMHWMLQMVHRTEGTVHSSSSEWYEHEYAEVEYYQRPSVLTAINYPFAARPTITGQTYPGALLTCTAYCPGVSQLRYEWYYEDGYPIGAVRSIRGPIFPVKVEDVGQRLRVKVISVGHWEDGEVWSDLTPEVTANLDTLTSATLNFSANSYTVNGTTYTSLAALQAAWPVGFQRNAVASMHNIDDSFTKRIDRHVPRIDSRGLVYQPAGEYASRINGEYGGQTGGTSYISNTFAEDSPIGPKTAVAWTESSASAITPRVTLSSGGLTAGRVYSGTVLVKPGYRKWLEIYSHDDPISFDSQHRAWYNLEGAGSLGTVQGDVTASIYALQGAWTGWYMCSWSKTATATDTVSEPGFYIAFRGANGAEEETGDPLQVAGYFAAATTSMNAGVFKDFYFLHLQQSGTARDELTLPLGLSPKTLTLTMVNPWTNAESTVTITDVSGDYVVPTQDLPIIKQIVIS